MSSQIVKDTGDVGKFLQRTVNMAPGKKKKEKDIKRNTGKYALPCIFLFLMGKKEFFFFFVTSVLETLGNNSSPSHKCYRYRAARVRPVVSYLPRKCQLWNLCCGRHGERRHSPTLVRNHCSVLLCTTAVPLPAPCSPFSLAGSRTLATS